MEQPGFNGKYFCFSWLICVDISFKPKRKVVKMIRFGIHLWY